MKKSPPKKRTKQLRALVGTSLVTASLFQLALPVLAAGTAAGRVISNTATADFTDDSGTPKTTTSNTVELKVAEVAGLTNVAQVPLDVNAGSVIPGDTVQFPFLITNTGNDDTSIYIPTTVTTQNLNSPGVYVDVTGDGQPDYYLPTNGDPAQTVTITNDVFAPSGTNATGAGIPTPTPTGYIVPNIGADKSITVIVQGTVANVVSGAIVNAQLGNTNSNQSSNPNSQNQPDSADTALAEEVRTVDGTTTSATEQLGDPINGEREAADTSDSLTVGQEAPKPLALATILKNAVSVDNKGTTGVFTDDVITYNLSLKVANDVPLGFNGYVPAGLEGTNITVDTATVKRVLVSDAVPTGTVLDAATPLAPSGWTIVYTTNALTVAPTDANWETTRPASGITRVGYIYNGVVAKNTTVTGFEFYVVASGSVADSSDLDGDGNVSEATPIYNLAQVFGQTEGGPATTVFDESGDQNPNNFEDRTGDGLLDPPLNPDNTPNPYGEYDPTEDFGDPGTPTDPNADVNNNNTGTGTDGEPNKLELGEPPTPPPPGNLVNGPKDQAGAIGPTGNNDDFTNKAVSEGVTTGSNLDPSAFTFNNSVRNVSGVNLQNVILRPITPAQANEINAAGQYEVTDALPNGTTVRIVYDVNGDGDTADVGESVLYTWTAGAFDSPANPVQLPLISVGQEIDYQVIVDLPNTDAFKGYSVPIVAYVNNDGNDSFDPVTELINNITIDRLYTGYLKLTKEARILRADGTTTPWTSSADEDANAKPAPGDRIEYRITYENVSSAAPPNGQFNGVLNAQNVVIKDEGLDLVAGQSGDWALDVDVNGIIDTSNATGTAVASQGAVQYFNGNPPAPGIDQNGTTAASDVTQYTNTVGTVVPGQSGTFSFQRILN
jgi:hypothetical protein